MFKKNNELRSFLSKINTHKQNNARLTVKQNETAIEIPDQLEHCTLCQKRCRQKTMICNASPMLGALFNRVPNITVVSFVLYEIILVNIHDNTDAALTEHKEETVEKLRSHIDLWSKWNEHINLCIKVFET